MTTDGQTPSGQLFQYPTGIVRLLLRLPVFLYRLGLGVLLGPLYLVVLTTRGHRSGLPRFTAIEYREHGRKLYLVSAWGSRPNWFRNLLADPHVTVQHGYRHFPALARVVDDPGEALRVLHLFRRRSPFIYDPVLARLSGRDKINPITLPDITDQFTIVRLDRDPSEALTLPPVGADLAWLLPATALVTTVTCTLVLFTRIRPRR